MHQTNTRNSYNFKWNWELSNPNFDEFIAAYILSAPESAKSELPDELSFKIFKGKHTTATGGMTFLQKIYFLYKVAKKRIFVIVEDEEKGLSIEDFIKYRDGFKKRKPSISEAEQLQMNHGFCFGSKDLVDSLDYFNMLSVGPAYAYLINARNASVQTSKVDKFRTAMTQMMRMLTFYESNKKRMVMDVGVSLSEWYLLMHLYSGEKKGSDAYNIVFRYAYNSSKGQMIKGLTRLAHQGHIEKFGSFKNATYRITASGVELIHKLIRKYILEY